MLKIFMRACADNPLKSKERPRGFSKQMCLDSILAVIGNRQFTLIFDGNREQFDATYPSFDFGRPNTKVIIKQLGSNIDSFLYQLVVGLEKTKDSEFVYFLEDDYIHSPNLDLNSFCSQIFSKSISDNYFFTFYDHLDKYPPMCSHKFVEIDYGGFRLKNVWSTTYTFIAKASLIKKHYVRLFNSCNRLTGILDDHGFFSNKELLVQPSSDSLTKDCKYPVFSTIPGYSTHCHISFMTPNVDWNKIINDYSKV